MNIINVNNLLDGQTTNHPVTFLSKVESHINRLNIMNCGLCYYARASQNTAIKKIDIQSNFIQYTNSFACQGNLLTWKNEAEINTTGEYKDTNTLLNYFKIANSINGFDGIIELQLDLNEYTNQNVLISSSQLSGCTVCVLFFKTKNKLCFYHVGGNQTVGYTQGEKNINLLGAILLDVWHMYDNFPYNEELEQLLNNTELTEQQLIYGLILIERCISRIEKASFVICSVYMKGDNITDSREYSESCGIIRVDKYVGKGSMIFTKKAITQKSRIYLQSNYDPQQNNNMMFVHQLNLIDM
ncbi:MAG: hypothetical protein K2J47_00970 [Ruminococcus sp.]|nr:hypothetical protein [Ruminococcus sp.]